MNLKGRKNTFMFNAIYIFLSFLYFKGEKWSKHVLDKLCEIHLSAIPLKITLQT